MTLDGSTLYAVESMDGWIEHQRIGTRYRVQEQRVETYSDRLYLTELLDRMAAGGLQALSREEYAERKRNIERLERLA